MFDLHMFKGFISYLYVVLLLYIRGDA